MRAPKTHSPMGILFLTILLASCGGDPGTSDSSLPDAVIDAPNGDVPIIDDSGTSSCTPITVSALPAGDLAALSAFFSQYASVFGVHIVASASVPEAKVLHAAAVMAQYLDNDEDGVPDDPQVVASMTAVNSILVMFETVSELWDSAIFEGDVLDGFAGQDLYGSETQPAGSSREGGFDVTLEEVLHLVTSKGYARAYPIAFGEAPGSMLTNAMDLARGGRFEAVPSMYPASAWYHYDDTTCTYECMATEYFYWALTSILDAQNYHPGRCEDIAGEWELCTSALVEERDPAIYALLTAGEHTLPTRLPDGHYCE